MTTEDSYFILNVGPDSLTERETVPEMGRWTWTIFGCRCITIDHHSSKALVSVGLLTHTLQFKL